MDIKSILSKMSIEEKAELLNGTSFWYTKSFPKYEIPSIRVSDGPNGLRKVNDSNIGGAIKATCFPPLCTLANTWDESLAYEMGLAIGEECQENKVNIILGPGINIKRSPLGGRNFEYLSEDPFLAGKLACDYVSGVQSQGVGVSLKHYCCNNEEDYRFFSDSLVDERALREIYLKAFEMVVKNAHPDTIMASYNRFEGVPVTESKRLLIDIARNEWDFQGVFMSDWGAVSNRVKALEGGLDLEMPGDNRHSVNLITKSVDNNLLDKGAIDRSCSKILSLVEKLKEKEKPNFKYDGEAHQKLATNIAASGAVLLKNKDNILPLKKGENVSIIGALAEKMRFEGGGSSQVNPTRLVQPLDALKTYGIFPFERGYSLTSDSINDESEKKAISIASRTDKILFFAGLREQDENEGTDRKTLTLPNNQLHLINALISLNKPIIVVLFNGSVVELPFEDKVSAILDMYLPGQGGGTALSQLLFGEINPSGKLAETWPKKLEDNPTSSFFNASQSYIEYRESIYVGYRYYQKTRIAPLYPFGYGLSYTKFEYSDLKVKVEDDASVSVSFKVKNVGQMAGAEISELYIGHDDTAVFKAPNELKRFSKAFLQPGQEKDELFTLSYDDFAYYNYKEKKWITESGYYQIKIGRSCEDIALCQDVNIQTGSNVQSPYDPAIVTNYMSPSNNVFPRSEFETIVGYSVPKEKDRLPLTMDSPLSDFKLTRKGRMIIRLAKKVLARETKKSIRNGTSPEEAKKTMDFGFNSLLNCTLNMAYSASGGKITRNTAFGLLKIANGKTLSGLCFIIFKGKKD
jgi:beta-glucosidase